MDITLMPNCVNSRLDLIHYKGKRVILYYFKGVDFSSFKTLSTLVHFVYVPMGQ